MKKRGLLPVMFLVATFFVAFVFSGGVDAKAYSLEAEHRDGFMELDYAHLEHLSNEELEILFEPFASIIREHNTMYGIEIFIPSAACPVSRMDIIETLVNSDIDLFRQQIADFSVIILSMHSWNELQEALVEAYLLGEINTSTRKELSLKMEQINNEPNKLNGVAGLLDSNTPIDKAFELFWESEGIEPTSGWSTFVALQSQTTWNNTRTSVRTEVVVTFHGVPHFAYSRVQTPIFQHTPSLSNITNVTGVSYQFSSNNTVVTVFVTGTHRFPGSAAQAQFSITAPFWAANATPM